MKEGCEGKYKRTEVEEQNMDDREWRMGRIMRTKKKE